jgi:hypothetical protein
LQRDALPDTPGAAVVAAAMYREARQERRVTWRFQEVLIDG